jgi:class 3 adenylate cyclase
VGGLLPARSDHVDAVADVTLAMRNELARHSVARFGQLQMRFGIDSGTVVAGGYRQTQVQLRAVERYREHRRSDGAVHHAHETFGPSQG